jgi:hypothetical protein
LTNALDDHILYITVRALEGNMAYYTYTKDPIGCFVEKDTGNYFEYSVNDDGLMLHYPHKIWVGGEGVCGMSGYRYGKVMKTVVLIVTDEDDCGLVEEKWYIKSNKVYA